MEGADESNELWRPTKGSSKGIKSVLKNGLIPASFSSIFALPSLQLQ